MAKKPTTKKQTRKPARAVSLEDVRPSKPDSLLRIDATDDVADDAAAVTESGNPAGKGKTGRKPAAKAKVKAAAAPKAAKSKAKVDEVPAPKLTTAMHGETRYSYADERGLQMLAWFAPIADAVHAAGRVRITSAIQSAGVTTMHLVLPGHEPPYDLRPGLILVVDEDGALLFDHVSAGRADADLIERTAYAVLTAMSPEDGIAASPSGRHPAWFERSLDAIASLDAA